MHAAAPALRTPGVFPGVATMERHPVPHEVENGRQQGTDMPLPTALRRCLGSCFPGKGANLLIDTPITEMSDAYQRVLLTIQKSEVSLHESFHHLHRR
jgi:hypothetical protein